MVPFKQGVLTGKMTAGAKPVPDYIVVRKMGSELGIQSSPTHPIKIVFSHGDSHDYLHIETKTIPQAWSNIKPNITYWLYWDLDLYTGKRSFGLTAIEPILNGPAPTEPQEDQHWYDHQTNTMKVFVGGLFVQRVRVFSAKYKIGAPIDYYRFGSQVGVTTNTNPHLITRDYTNTPIRDFVRGKAKFKSSGVPFAKVASSATNSIMESVTDPQIASADIPSFALVAQTSPNTVGLASVSGDLPCFGVAVNSYTIDDDVKIVTEGYVTNSDWRFDIRAGSTLYCGDNGDISISPGGQFIQQIGLVVSPNTILLSISQPIYVDDHLPYGAR